MTRRTVIPGVLAGLLTLLIPDARLRADEEGLKETQSVTKDLIQGKPEQFETEFRILFRTTKDQFKPLESKDVLTRGVPTIEAPKGLKVEVLGLTASDAKITNIPLGMEYRGGRRVSITGSGDGYAIRCQVRLTAGEGLSQGYHKVTVSLPHIKTIAGQLGAGQFVGTPTLTVDVESFHSQKAYDDAVFQRRLRLGLIIGGVVVGVVLLTFVYLAIRRRGRQPPAVG